LQKRITNKTLAVEIIEPFKNDINTGDNNIVEWNLITI
jgi:hypothetical protein